jgi:hypothetical protein
MTMRGPKPLMVGLAAGPETLRARSRRATPAEIGERFFKWETFPLARPQANPAPEGPAASQSRQAGAAITGAYFASRR